MQLYSTTRLPPLSRSKQHRGFSYNLGIYASNGVLRVLRTHRRNGSAAETDLRVCTVCGSAVCVLLCSVLLSRVSRKQALLCPLQEHSGHKDCVLVTHSVQFQARRGIRLRLAAVD